MPTIGIGSGPYTDGQVLGTDERWLKITFGFYNTVCNILFVVYHDMLGMMQHYHHAEFTPRFCKQYATVGREIQDGKHEEPVKCKPFAIKGVLQVYSSIRRR